MTDAELFGDVKPLSDAELFGGTPADKPPTNTQGDTSRGFTRAFAQVPELAYGTGALASMAAEKLFGEGGLSTTAKNYFGEKFAAKQAENQKHAPTVEFTDAWDNLGKEPGKMVDWIQDTAGYVVGQGLQTIATGGLGAIAGRMTLGTLVAGSAAKAADKMVAAKVAEMGLTGEAAATMAQTMLPAATAQAARNLTTALGSGAVLSGQNLGMEAGDIYGGLIEESKNTGKEITGADVTRAWLSAGAAAGTETLTDMLGLGALTGRIKIGGKGVQEMTGVTGRLARAGTAAAVGMPVEGAQEWVQTGLEQYGAGKPLDTPEAAKERINAAAVGVLGGGLMGGGIGAIQGAQNTDEAIRAAQDVAFGGATGTATAAIDEFKTGGMGQDSPEQQAANAAQQEMLAAEAAQAELVPSGLMMSAPIPDAPGVVTQQQLAQQELEAPPASLEDLQAAAIARAQGAVTAAATEAGSSVQPLPDATITPVARPGSGYGAPAPAGSLEAMAEQQAAQRADAATARGLMQSQPQLEADAAQAELDPALVTTAAPPKTPATLGASVSQQQLAQQEQPVLGKVPTTVGKTPSDSLDNDQLLTIINDPATHANTRRAAQAVLGSRMSQMTPPRGQAQPVPTQGAQNGQGMQDTQTTPEALSPDDKAVLTDFGPGARLRTMSDVQRTDKVSVAMRTALTMLSRLTGTQVVFVDSDRADGMTYRGNKVYINVRSTINPLQILGHETTHVLKKKHREAWAAIRAATSAAVDDNALAEFGRDYWGIANPERAGSIPTGDGLAAWLAQRPAALGVDSTEATVRDFLMDEMISDLGGGRFSDPEFWNNVFQRIEEKHGTDQAKGIIQRLVAAVKEMIAKFMIIAKRDGFAEFKTEGMVAQRVTPEQLRAIQVAIEKAYAGFISAERTNEPVGYAPARAAAGTRGTQGDDELADLEAAQQSPARVSTKKSAEERKGRTLDEVRSRVAADMPLAASADMSSLVNGQDFETLDLDVAGPGLLIPDAAVAMRRMMDESITESLLTPELAKVIKVPSVEYVDKAMRLTNGARFWYELSAEGFAGKFFKLTKQMTERLIDIVAGTSGGQKPTDNLRIAIAAMAQDMQGLPVTTGVRDPSSLTGALSPEALTTHKFGNFSDTMQTVAKLRNVKPLPTIDLQMASVFGIKHAEVASNPVMYEVLSRFLLKLRDAQNAHLDEGAQPYESWQMQALLWVANRKAADPDSYNIGMPRIVNQLQAAGIPVPGGKITIETLEDPRTPEVLAPTTKSVPETETMTLETRTMLTKVGAQSADTYAQLHDIDVPWAKKLRDEFEAIQRRTMRALGNKMPHPEGLDTKQPSVISQLMSIVLDKTTASYDATRVDLGGYGTFEGAASPNMRVPLLLGQRGGSDGKGGTPRFTMTEQQRLRVMAVLGKHLKQAAMAASQFNSVELGKHETFSILIRRYDKADITEAQLAVISNGIGRPVNYSSVPNGWLIDINVGGFDPVTDIAQVRDVMDGMDLTGALRYDIIPRGYSSDYLEAADYGKHIRGLENEIRKSIDASGSRASRRAEQRAGDLVRIREQLTKVAAEQERAFRDWNKDATAKLAKRGPDAASSRPAGESPASQSLPRYGRPADRHAVSVTGVHYSREQRPELSSRYFGTGLKGQERLRVAAATDPRIKRRLYFYANTGRGISPEADVGSHAHTVGLDNVYDMDVDPLRLYVQPAEGQPYRSVDMRMNDFESAVIDAGYDGYMTREFGTGGAVVLLGDHSVPVQYEGAGARPDTETTPAPRYSDLQKLRREIAANRALPSGRLSGLEWKRILMREMPEVDPRWLDNAAYYYKGDLLAGAEEATGATVSVMENVERADISHSAPRVPIREYDNLVQGGNIRLFNDTRYKISEQDVSTALAFVRAGASALFIDDAKIDVTFSSVSDLGGNLGLADNAGGRSTVGIRVATLRDVIRGMDTSEGQRASAPWLATLIAHELVHVRQFETGYFKQFGEAELDKFYRGKWASRPWEKQAAAAERSIGQQIIEDLVGQGVLHPDVAARNPLAPRDSTVQRSEIRTQADAIKAMTEDQRDNLDPYEFGYRGYVLYEAEKMMPKKDGTFKSVNENNSFALWQEADAVVNVDGKPFLATKQEDPDDDADEGLYVWSFSDPESGGAGADVQTDWSDKTEAVAQLRSKLGGVQRSERRNLTPDEQVASSKTAAVEWARKMTSLKAGGKERDSAGRLLAPNGKLSNLTEEQYDQVREPAFLEWFGDWLAVHKGADEQGNGVWAIGASGVSKVVDENGEPLVVHHGTIFGGFTVMDPSMADKHRSSMIFTAKTRETSASYAGRRAEIDISGPDISEMTGADLRQLGYDIYFDEEDNEWAVWGRDGYQNGKFATEAEAIANAREDFSTSGDPIRTQSGIYSLFLNIRDPYEAYFDGANWDGQPNEDAYIITDENGDQVEALNGDSTFTYDDAQQVVEMESNGADWNIQSSTGTGETTNDVAEAAKRYGNDGAIIRQVLDDGGKGGYVQPDDVFVFFDAKQAKSATQHVGPNYDTEDLRFSTRRTVEETTASFTDAVRAYFKAPQPQPVALAEVTPASLQIWGWRDLPLVVEPDVIEKMFYDHGVTIPQLGKLPAMLHRPMMIFADEKNGSLVFAGDDFKSGKVAIVAMKPDRNNANMVVTGYAPANGWDEITKRLMRGELIYRDTSKTVPESVRQVVTAAQKKYAQVGRRLPRELLQGSGLQNDSLDGTRSGTLGPTANPARAVLERAYSILGQSDLVKFEREEFGDSPRFSTPRATWTPERIDRLMSKYAYTMKDDRTKAYAAWISPDDFLNLTASNAEREIIESETRALSVADLAAQTQELFLYIRPEGLAVGERIVVEDHEGRHRMVALKRAGVTRVPVVLAFYGGARTGLPIVPKGYLERQRYASEWEAAGPGEVFDAIPIDYEHEQQLRDTFGGPGDVQFSTPRHQIPQMWQDNSKLDAWDNLTRKLQDKLIDTKRIVAAIREAGIAIKDKFDPYLQETLFHGRAATAVGKFAEDELRPLYVEMQARGVTVKEFDDYLWARHATERNAQIAKINPGMPDGGSGLTNQQAADVLAGRAVTVQGRTIQLQPARMASYAALAARVDAITKRTTDLLVSSGLESQATIDKWRATYGNYVPLMRDMESDDNYSGAMNLGMGTGQGFNVKGSASKRAQGSERDVVDVLANVAMQRERAITRAEKNRVSTAVYGLALTATNPEFWLPINPDSNNPALQQKVEDELVMMGLSRTDAAAIAKEPTQTYIDKNGMTAQRINPQLRGRDNVLALRVNGQDRYVFFSSDERAQQMVRNLKNLDNEQMGEIMSHVAKVTRYFSSINTQFNPVFGLTNGIRDLGTGMLNLSSTPLKGQRKRVLAYAISALRGIYSDLRDHRAGRQPTSRWALEFEEFAREGGQTGYRDMFATSKDRAEAIAKEIQNAGKGASLLALDEKRSPIFGWLSDYNTSIENAIRLAAYKVAKEDGMTKERSAELAKNLTVNFNKKGLAATQAGAMYAFFNAAVQGTARIGATMVKRDTQTGKVGLTDAGKKIAYGGVMFGVMQALMLSLAGYDDEEPPQFIREKNIIIPMGYRGKYISLPMPLGFHVIPNLGRIPTEFILNGFRKPGDRLVQLFRVVGDAFNPIGSSTPLQMVTPTIVDPLAALAENKDWSGKSIYKEDFNKMEPTAGWTRKKDTASDLSKWLSYSTNYITGGGKYGIGVASPTPDQIDYLIGQATGGVGRESLKLWQAAKTPLTGEELPMYKFPVAGRFIGNTSGQESQAAKFYDNLKRIGEHDSALKEIKRSKDSAAYTEYMRENPDARQVKLADKASRDVSLLKKQKRDALENGDAALVRNIEKQLESRIGYYNKLLSER